jgi:hypothetical protein
MKTEKKRKLILPDLTKERIKLANDKAYNVKLLWEVKEEILSLKRLIYAVGFHFNIFKIKPK